MFDQSKADAICRRLENGESLRSAATAEGTTHSVVLFWAKERPEFADQYARAREIGYALLADEIIAISDENDFEPVPGESGDDPKEVRFDSAAVARNRLRVDSRKWMLSKMLPKVYGDKLAVEHSGSVGIADTLRQARERRRSKA